MSAYLDRYQGPCGRRWVFRLPSGPSLLHDRSGERGQSALEELTSVVEGCPAQKSDIKAGKNESWEKTKAGTAGED